MANTLDLIKALQRSYPDLKNDIKLIVDIVFQGMIDSLVEENRIEIRGFGSFSIRKRKSRIGSDPRTQAPIFIEPRNYVYYRAAKKINALINAKPPHVN